MNIRARVRARVRFGHGLGKNLEHQWHYSN